MKFIAWLFNFTNRHHADVFRYERKGILYRISILLLLTALGALVLFLEDWSFSIFNVSRLETFVTGFFAVLLFIATFIPTLELYVLYDEIEKLLSEKGIKVHRSYVGNYFTSLEMSGATLTIMKLDDELKELVDMPAYSMGLKQR